MNPPETKLVSCPYCKKGLPGQELGPRTHVEIRAETEGRPIEPGEHRVICERCDQPWLIRYIALAPTA